MARRKKPQPNPKAGLSWRESHGITNPLQRAFLAALSIVGQPTAAAKISHVSKQTHYNWLNAIDKDGNATADATRYAGAAREAVEQAGDNLEHHVWKMAMDAKKPNLVAAIFLLKGIRPEKYRERFVAEHTGPKGGPIETNTNVAIVNLEELRSPERLQAVTALIRSTGLENNFPELFKGSDSGNGNGSGNGKH